MQVRRIERCVGDVTAVAPIIQECFNPSKEFYTSYLKSLERYKQPEAPAGIYVMYVDDRPIGSFELVWGKEVINLRTVCILPALQRKRYGAWMMKRIIELAGGRTVVANGVDTDHARRMYITAGITVAEPAHL